MANPQRGVVVSFVADDSKFKKGVNSASRHSKKFQQNQKGLQGTLKKLGPMLNSLAVRGLQAFTVGLGAGIREFANFQDALTESTAIMQTTEDQLKSMEEASIQVARTTTFTATESAKAFFFLASAGLDAEQSIGALPQVSKFAQAGAFDLALATDLLTDAQSSLGLTSKDTAENIENMARVSDVLVKANTLANASVQQFSEALTNKAGASLKVANKSIEEGVAVLSFFADQGVKGAEAGEKLNVVLRDIPRAGARNPQLFRDMGIEIFNAEGNLKNMSDIVGEFTRVLGPMDDGLKATTLEQLGLTRSVGDAIKILLGGENQIKKYESALKSAGGTTNEVAEKQLQSLKKQSQLAFNELRIAGQILGKEFEPELRDALELIKSFAGFLQGDFLDSLRSSTASMSTISDAFSIFSSEAEASEDSGYGFRQMMLENENIILRVSKALVPFRINFSKSIDEMDALGDEASAMIQTQIDFNTSILEGNDNLMAGAKALNEFAGSGQATIPTVKEFLDTNNLNIKALDKLVNSQNAEIRSLSNLDEIVKLVNGALFEQNVTTNRLYRSQMFATNVVDQFSQAEEDAKERTEALRRAEEHLGDTTGFLEEDLIALGRSLKLNTKEMEINERNARLLDKTYRSGLFKSAESLANAFDKFQSIQEKGKTESERLKDATKDEEDAYQDVKTAEQQLEQARINLSNAQSDGTEVTIREAFELKRLNDRLAELKDGLEAGEVSLLEFQVAQLDLAEATQRSQEQSNEYRNLLDEVTRAEENVASAQGFHEEATKRVAEAQEELKEATDDTFQSLLAEAQAVEELQSALDGFENGNFIDAITLIAEKTGETFTDILNEFNALKSQLGSGFSPSAITPDPGSLPPPLTEIGSESESAPGNGRNGNSGSTGSAQQPVKIYTTLQIDNERFETVTQNALINLQKQGKKIIL